MNRLWKLYSNHFDRITSIRYTPTNKFSMQFFVRRCSLHSIRIHSYLDFHRDDTPRTRLVAFAHQITNCSLIDKEQRAKSNIDKHDSVDMDINELLIKPWCARFCPRCYAYKYYFSHIESSNHFLRLVVYYIRKVHRIYQYRNKFPYQ